jgi:MFS transporter, PAT family, beta-lactamase induction signal transducer AmpG
MTTTTAHSPSFGYASIVWWLVPLGLLSGLPLALVGRTLTAGWMTDSGADLSLVGIFAGVMLPYSLKFLWAPLIDAVALPGFGRRRGWAMLCQAAMAVVLVMMTTLDARADISALAACAVALSFLSASQDVALDAYRTELLSAEQRAAGAAVFVTGYRLGMLTSGALAFVLADHVPWSTIYRIMATILVVGVIVTAMAPEPTTTTTIGRGAPWRQALTDFAGRPGAGTALLFLLLYKLGDAFAGGLTGRFLKDIGFSNTQVGALDAGLGIAATIIGGLLAGVVVPKLGLRRALVGFGALQALTNLGFAALAVTGANSALLVVVVLADNIASGLGSAALVATMTAWCNVRFSATQYAVFSSLSNAAARVLGATAGALAATLGWGPFFVTTVVMAIPGLWLASRLRVDVDAASR